MHKKFIYICSILSVLLLIIGAITFREFRKIGTDHTNVSIAFNSFTIIPMTSEDSSSMVSMIEEYNESTPSSDFKDYKKVARIQFSQRHAYMEAVYFNGAVSLDDKFYASSIDMDALVSKYLTGENILKNSAKKASGIKLCAEDINGRFITLNSTHSEDFKAYVRELSCTPKDGSISDLKKKSPGYTFILSDGGSDEVRISLIDENTIYVYGALKERIVKTDSEDLWNLAKSLTDNKNK